jgi:hypothetical protein
MKSLEAGFDKGIRKSNEMVPGKRAGKKLCAIEGKKTKCTVFNGMNAYDGKR